MKFLKKVAIVFSLVFLLSSSVELAGLSNNKAEAASYTYTDWMFHSTVKNNVKAEKFTAGAIGIVISSYLPWTKGKIATNLANLYYQLNKSNVYMTIDTYQKFANTGTHLKPIAGVKTVVRFYTDSARTNLIKTETNYEYTSWYE